MYSTVLFSNTSIDSEFRNVIRIAINKKIFFFFLPLLAELQICVFLYGSGFLSEVGIIFMDPNLKIP